MQVSLRAQQSENERHKDRKEGKEGEEKQEEEEPEKEEEKKEPVDSDGEWYDWVVHCICMVCNIYMYMYSTCTCTLHEKRCDKEYSRDRQWVDSSFLIKHIVCRVYPSPPSLPSLLPTYVHVQYQNDGR